MNDLTRVYMRSIAGFVIGMLLHISVYGQDVEFSASATPNVLRVGEQLNLVYTSNQQLTDLEIPEITDFEFLGGPSQGHSQSVYSENGKITTTSTYQYTYFFRASKEGRFTIPAGTARIRNREYKSNEVVVEVVTGRNPSPQAGGTTGPGQDMNTQDEGNRLFIRLIPDKSEVFLGEQITVSIKLFSQVDLSGIDYNFKGPDFTGFFMESIEVPPLRSLEREIYDEDIFGTGVLRKAVIIPQQTGEMVIQPFELNVSERQEVRRRMADPWFDEFFFPEVENVNRTLVSLPVRIKVKPLPANVPESFTGAVGNFSLSATLSHSEAAINEPLTLRYTVTGTGNLKLMDEPLFDIPAGIEKYDPVINTKMSNALSGTKTYEYLLIPQASGSYTLPPAALSFFDPGTEEYVTLFAPAFTLEVAQGEWDSLAVSPGGVFKEDVQLLNQDIRFIKTDIGPLRKAGTFFAGSVLHHVLMGIVIMVFLILLWLRNRLKAYHADVVMLKNRKASKYARRRLKHCHDLLAHEDYKQFYDVLLSALWRYLSDKLNIPLSRLSRETASEKMRKKKADEDVIREFLRIIGECEVARYAPSSGHEGSRHLYESALEIISKLHQQLK